MWYKGEIWINNSKNNINLHNILSAYIYIYLTSSTKNDNYCTTF